MKQLLEHLSFCNKHMKYYTLPKKEQVISNTKFYNLKSCVLNSLITFHAYYNISIEKFAICEDMQGKSLVSMTIRYKGLEYEFHQPLENVKYSLSTYVGLYGTPGQWPKIEYMKSEDKPEMNWERFKDGIEYIKWWVWDNYKYTLGNINLFVNKPCQYLSLLSYIKPNVIIELYRNGVFVKDYNGAQIGYGSTVRLKDSNIAIKQGSLKEIRKNLKYLLYTHENKRNE